VIEERTLQLQHCMYQYSRAIYRSIKDLIDPYADRETQIESRRAVLEACEQTMERLAKDPLYFAKPDRALFQDIRRHFPITAQAEVAWAVQAGVTAIERKRDLVSVRFRQDAPVDPGKLASFVSSQRGAQFLPDGTLKFVAKGLDPKELLEQLQTLLGNLAENIQASIA